MGSSNFRDIRNVSSETLINRDTRASFSILNYDLQTIRHPRNTDRKIKVH